MPDIGFYDLKAQHALMREQMQAAFARVLDSGHFILGPELEAFEQAFATYCGVKHCIGVGNGLDALTLILRALNIGKGGEVIVPAHTFIATWLAVSATGATPVPVETDRHFTLDPERLERAITERTRAIMPVHLYGHPADRDALALVIGARPIVIVEDAAQAQGACYKGQKTGSLGIAAGFSFYPGKNLGALGDAGAVTTNDDALAHQVRLLRNYGSERKYVHEIEGCNSRLDEIQAALLSAKLPYLDRFNRQRQAIAAMYLEGLSAVPFIALPVQAEWAGPVWHQFVIRSKVRDALRAHLLRQGIETLIHYPVPNHLQLAYKSRHGFTHLEAYEAMTGELLSLPMSPTLTSDQVQRICHAIADFKA